MAHKPRNVLSKIAQIKIAMIVIALMFISFFSSPVLSANSLEHKVKVATFFKLLKFVNWGNSSSENMENSHLNICVAGKHQISNVIKLLNGKQVKGHTIKVYLNTTPQSDVECHALYITQGYKSNFQEFLQKNTSPDILTVSDIKGFAEAGGMIELALIENKIRLIINRQTTNKSSIQLSSKLLDIAILIGKNGNMLSEKPK